MMDKQDRAYSSHNERLEKFGLVQRVCGTNTVQVRAGASLWIIYHDRKGVFVQTCGHCMHASRNNIFQRGAFFGFCLASHTVYMGLKMWRDDQLCLR